jgi:glycosyltransferase involved in cell wall biosynthesis
MELNIGILGTRGIPNHYGGFEQVASFLAKGLVDKGHKVSVYNPHDHPFGDAYWNGVRILRCYCPPLGTTGQFIYDYNCLRDSEHRQFDVLLLLGYTSSSVWGRWYPKGPVILNNMDGLEWKRAKYPYAIRLFLKYAERLAVRYCDYTIADSTAIRDYLHWQYGVRARYIPYGAEVPSLPQKKYLKRWNLTPGSYCVLMARMEPENNLEMVLEGFRRAQAAGPGTQGSQAAGHGLQAAGPGSQGSQAAGHGLQSAGPGSQALRLLVIGDTANRYGKHLIEKFGNDPGIVFTGSLFDQQCLHSLRAHARLYFHGHSVGGTNPSLLEAMASGALIAAHDNPFNRAILGDDAYYFTDPAAVSSILQGLEKLPSRASATRVSTVAHLTESEHQMMIANFDKIDAQYNWEKVINAYEKFMYECYVEKRRPVPLPTISDFPAVRPLLQ